MKSYAPYLAIIKVNSHPLRDETDFWRVYTLLQEIASIKPPGFVWDIRWWDSRMTYSNDPGLAPSFAENVHLWETTEGRLVGVVNTESGQGDVWLQIHPDFRYLEAEMLDWAEANLRASVRECDGRQIHIRVFEYDLRRQQLLKLRDYEKTEHWGHVWRKWLGHNPIPEPNVPVGYAIVTPKRNSYEDGQRVADMLNAAFERNFHVAEEHMNFSRLSPSYCEHLDLVIEAADRTFVAYAAVNYDEANRRGIFEPVCTHPKHRKKGLASILMLEGMRRAQAMGMLDVTVETGSLDLATRLYDSMGFTERFRFHFWMKKW